ncbi:uncharacterized protein H6S33_004265 [Morchella sextelata]|uniref:uncharacterized protein n=1 Tax=Morchella sextelata TaxID=1174677 RepID=UPI001D04EB25|nr:uncharacterized protein H6S33_004265 [Morchella sextelata]KAH0605808.1 hypothetical protein H6S33_004265 [Morchella sextelata]
MEDENDNDIETSAQLEAMGFTSFGQQPKRPKHRHHGPSGPPGSPPRVEIPKEAAPAPLSGDDTSVCDEAGGSEQQRHKASRSYGQVRFPLFRDYR